MFATLLDRIDPTGAVVTADAVHAQRAHAGYLAGQRGAHYLITVKDNQPGLRAQLAGLPWRQVPAAHDTHEKGHRRKERRIVKVTAVAAGLTFPHAAQAIQIVSRRRPLHEKKWSTQTVYAITSLAATQSQPVEYVTIISRDIQCWAQRANPRSRPWRGPRVSLHRGQNIPAGPRYPISEAEC